MRARAVPHVLGAEVRAGHRPAAPAAAAEAPSGPLELADDRVRRAALTLWQIEVPKPGIHRATPSPRGRLLLIWRDVGRWCRAAQRGDGGEQLAAVPDRRDAHLFQILGGEVRQHRHVAPVVTERCLVLAEAAQPSRHVRHGMLLRGGAAPSSSAVGREESATSAAGIAASLRRRASGTSAAIAPLRCPTRCRHEDMRGSPDTLTRASATTRGYLPAGFGRPGRVLRCRAPRKLGSQQPASRPGGHRWAVAQRTDADGRSSRPQEKQRDAPCRLDRPSPKVRREAAFRRAVSALVARAQYQAPRARSRGTCASARPAPAWRAVRERPTGAAVGTGIQRSLGLVPAPGLASPVA